MKITLAYIPDEEETATATAAVLRQLHPGAKVRKSDRHPPFKHMMKLSEAQQLGLGTLLDWIGFPVYELVRLPDGRKVYEHRKGLVTLEGEYINE